MIFEELRRHRRPSGRRGRDGKECRLRWPRRIARQIRRLDEHDLLGGGRVFARSQRTNLSDPLDGFRGADVAEDGASDLGVLQAVEGQQAADRKDQTLDVARVTPKDQAACRERLFGVARGQGVVGEGQGGMLEFIVPPFGRLLG